MFSLCISFLFHYCISMYSILSFEYFDIIVCPIPFSNFGVRSFYTVGVQYCFSKIYFKKLISGFVY